MINKMNMKAHNINIFGGPVASPTLRGGPYLQQNEDNISWQTFAYILQMDANVSATSDFKHLHPSSIRISWMLTSTNVIRSCHLMNKYFIKTV